MSFLSPTIIQSIMGFLQPPLIPPTRFDDKSDRDLLIRLSVKMEHLQRTVVALTWAVGIVVLGIVPFSLLLAFYGAALWVLWRVGP